MYFVWKYFPGFDLQSQYLQPALQAYGQTAPVMPTPVAGAAAVPATGVAAGQGTTANAQQQQQQPQQQQYGPPPGMAAGMANPYYGFANPYFANQAYFYGQQAVPQQYFNQGIVMSLHMPP